jgi:hypothetical protein
VSATPGGYTLAGNVLTFTNLGGVGAGSQTTATVVVRPNAAGTITNTVATASLVVDPLKANNTATVKSIVQALLMSATVSGGNLTITWPASATGYTLQSTTSLNPPATWTPVSSPAPSLVNGQYTITISIGSGTKYFRLTAPGS